MSDATIATKNLIIRQWRDYDLKDLAAINQDPQDMKYFLATRTLKETRAFIQHKEKINEQ